MSPCAPLMADAMADFRSMPTANAEGSIGKGAEFAVGMPRKVAKNRVGGAFAVRVRTWTDVGMLL